jgi:hypothetical protein
MARRKLTITLSKKKTTQKETAKTPEVNSHSTSEAREHKHDPDPENNSDITNPLIISLGFDCGPQIVIKEKAEISQPSFPFDSCITYKGVSEIISNGYRNLLDNFILSSTGSYIDVRNGIKFKHDGKFIENQQGNKVYTQDKNKETTLEEVKDKYMRRLERLHKYLEAYNTSTNHQQIIFVRKSHDDNHHGEAREYGIEIKNDIVDTIELEGYLNSRYPKLNYLIVVFLICEDCFHNKKEGVDSILKDSKSTHIKIHYIGKNIITSRMTNIKKAYLRTNPKEFNSKLYCYTDKIKEKQIITLDMCGGNITNKTKSKAKAKAKTKAKTKTKSKKNKIAYRKNKKTRLNKK